MLFPVLARATTDAAHRERPTFLVDAYQWPICAKAKPPPQKKGKNKLADHLCSHNREITNHNDNYLIFTSIKQSLFLRVWFNGDCGAGVFLSETRASPLLTVGVRKKNLP